MGEIKSVKVDNWGVFFLQKLQNFFNKTDYCDLTLQFKDNSQLKVHRLVLSACTDFFNVLEQTCELMDDALVMPNELQADVVVPIVNFMYTGTLEFELKMYSKLLRTAREMNMTVLLKLLEAHKRTMDSTKLTGPKPGSPKSKPKRVVDNFPPYSKLIASPSTVSSSQQMQRRIVSANPSTPVRRITATARQVPGTTMFRQVVGGNSLLKAAPKMQKGPTRFDETNAPTQTYETSFDAMSYESRPLKEEPEDYDRIYMSPQKSRSSPFEQLRKGYNNNKRPAVSTFTSPPAKKPNIEDVKEFSEQQRMRKQIAAEYGDDAEYDGVLDDEFHNDDDDDEPSAGGQASTSSGRQQQQYEQASIIIKQSPNEKPTIVVKDSSNSKMDHAKIISEVLRQYPHLVKTNKNIKLKIMPNMGGQSQKIIIKKEAIENASAEIEQNRATGIQARQQLMEINKKSPTILRPQAKQTITAATIKTEAQISPQPRASTAVAATTTSGNAASAEAGKAPQQKRRIDSKTMHALIAMGAENTTGPWLCLQCGVNGRPISIPSYRGFRRHLVNTHKETIDPALCEHCGWRSSSNRVLHHHMLVEHKIPSTSHIFPQCDHCNQICLDSKELTNHIEIDHPDAHKQQCIYCNKIFSKELQLYLHMKSFHKKRARDDGVIDFTDDELDDFDEEMQPESTTSVDKKIKIISDISLPSTILKLEEAPSASEEDYANDSGPKFVNADGNEMVLTAEQREEIMAQLEQDPDGGVVMVLNESTFPPGEGEIETEGTTHESKEEENQHADEFDDANIYTGFPHEGEPANDTSADEGALEANKEEEERTLEHEQEQNESDHDERMDDDHMEWAEHVISAHDADDDDEEVQEDDEEKGETDAEKKKSRGKADATTEENARDSKSTPKSAKVGEKEKKKEEDINLKLKMLTGDWSDDEVDEEDDDTIADPSEKEKPQEETLITEEAKEKSKNDDDEEHPPETGVADEPEIKQEDLEKPVSETAEVDDAEENEEPSEVALPEKLDEAAKKNVEEPSPDIPKDDSVETEISEAKTADSAIETKEETKTTSTSKKPSSRRSSTKDDSAEEKLKDIKVEEDIDEEEKVPSPKESKEEPLASTDDEGKKDELPEVEVKSDKIVDKDDAVGTSKKSLDDDSPKTGDKVKSLISEWVDDDDEDDL